MPASNAIAAWGTLLKLGDGATPENFTTIAEVQDITPPAPTLLMEDATSHSSTGGWTENRPTGLEMGDSTFGILYLPTGATHDLATGLLGDLANKVLRNFQLVYPGAIATWSFSAYVQMFQPRAPVRGLLKADVTLRITGQPTLA